MASHNDVCLCGNVLNKHKTDELRSSVQFPNGVENGSKNQINMIDLSMDETRRESTKKTRWYKFDGNNNNLFDRLIRHTFFLNVYIIRGV